jgi:hypothetical protein
VLLFALAQNVQSQTPITSISTSTEVPPSLTTSSYTATSPSDAGGSISASTEYLVKYGEIQNLFATSYVAGGITYDNFVLPDTLIIQRTDAGRQLIIFYEYDNVDTGPSPDEIEIDAERIENEEALYLSGYLNAGYDNVLVNSATNFANVERIDVIYNQGVVTSSPSTAVFPIVERGGNDDIYVAAISALDGSGNPSAYYPNVIAVDNNGTSEWGNTGISHLSLVLRRQDAVSNPLPQITLGSQNIHACAVSFTDFGIAADEIVYGYSIMAQDVDVSSVSNIVDFTDATNFPTNTGGAFGLDLIAGISAAVASDDNLIRVAGPGGYKPALNTWLKANEGVTTSTDGSSVTDWQDQWLGNHDATTLGTAPTYRDGTGSPTEDINYNPTIDFIDDTDRGLGIANNSDFNTATSYTKKGINIAFRTGDFDTSKQLIYEQGGATRGINVYIRDGDLYIGAWNLANDDGTGPAAPWGFSSISTSSIAANTEYILSLEHDGNSLGNGTLTAYLNGQSLGVISSVGLLYAHGNSIGIGDINGSSLFDDSSTSADSFDGSISEFIYCNEPSSFSTSTRNQIESYLAIKYGVTLDQSTPINLVNSKGSTIFNTTDNASIGGFLEYNNDIAGIGRDDESELNQVRSQSENSGSVVDIHRSSVEGICTDNTWLIWGNDDASLVPSRLETKPDTINERLPRVWRVAEVNSMGVTDISFDTNGLSLSSNADDYSLLIAENSSAADFSSATIVTGGSFSGSVITFTDVDLSNGQYFTLGTEFFICTPGNVQDGLSLWLKADTETYNEPTGTALASDTDEVDYWGDQSRNNFDAVQGTNTANRPTWIENNVNFNPGLNFGSGSNETGFNLGSNYIFAAQSDGGLHVFAAVEPENSLTSSDRNRKYIVSFGDDSNNSYGVGAYGDRGTLVADGGNNFNIEPNSSSFIVEGEINSTGSTSDSQSMYIDGQIDNNTPVIVSTGIDIDDTGITQTSTHGIDEGPVSIGRSSESNTLSDNSGRRFFGDLREVIVYNEALDEAEKQQIRSYLAIKYGSTLTDDNNRDGVTNQIISGSIREGDYVASDGSTITFNYSEDTNFVSHVAGIGRDDNTCLEQRQSRSINDEAILTIGLGEIAVNNASNPNSFDDNLDFLTWASDGESTTFADRTTGVSGLGTVTERMTRIWRAQDNGNVGATDISFDLAGLGYTGSITDYQLIVSPNSSLTSPTIYQASNLISDVVTFTSVDILDGYYFTIGVARETCGPGGITGAITMWLKADNGTRLLGVDVTSGELDTWLEFSGNSTFTDVTTNDQNPSLVESGVNFRPYIEFNGVDEDLIRNDFDADVLFSDQNNTIFYAFNYLSNTGVVMAGWESDGTGERLAYYEKNGTALRNDMIGGTNLLGSLDITNRFVIATTLSDATNRTLFINGEEDDQESSASFTASGNQGDFALGSQPGAANYAPSQAAEMIIFNDDLTASDRRKVETYLAIKYGITLDNTAGGDAGDYLNSDNTILWDASSNSTYHNDIAGIGRDDASCYIQKQSASINDGEILTVGLSSIESSNANNLNNFSDDGDFLLWGNDGGSILQSTAETSDVPSTVSERMTRIWRVTDTGNVGETEIQFDLTGLGYGLDADDFRLIVAAAGSGGTMSGGSLIAGGSFDGSILSFTGVDLEDGEYFTLGTALTTCGPGGVNTNIGLWLRADREVFSDAGTTPALDTESIEQWNDQSSPAYDASEENGGGLSTVPPVFKSDATSSINYNPILFFTDQNTTNNSYMETAPATNSVDGNMTLITVFETAQNQGSNNDIQNTPALIGAVSTSDNNDYGLGIYQGEVVFNAANNNNYTVRSTSTYRNGEPYIATATRVQASSGAVNLYVNSLNVDSGSSDANSLSTPDSWAIGNHNSYDNDAQFQGNISEVLVFSSVLTALEQVRVESYLALKYGITRSDNNDGDGFPNENISGDVDEGDYVAADGDVIWDYAARGASFYHDIAGIGRDDLSCFEQTHSKSENDDALVDIEISSFIDNDAFFIWGNDNAAIEAPDNSERPASIKSRLNREWQAQETGNVGIVTVTFDISSVTGTPTGDNNLNLVRLMVSTNDDFSSGVTLVSPSAIDAVNKRVSFDYNFNVSEGFYYTLGSLEMDALPVELVHFEAKILNSQVLLNWATASEFNNYFFSIERSSNGEIFEEIGQVAGKGNSTDLTTYQFTDKNVAKGVNYYRLKQVDNDGTYAYSSVVRIVNNQDPILKFKLFPNPVQNGEILQLSTNSSNDLKGTIRIYSQQGLQIADQPLVSGLNLLPTQYLSSGIYLIRVVTDDHQLFTQAFIVK